MCEDSSLTEIISVLRMSGHECRDVLLFHTEDGLTLKISHPKLKFPQSRLADAAIIITLCGLFSHQCQHAGVPPPTPGPPPPIPGPPPTLVL